jgi:carbamoyltransferase
VALNCVANGRVIPRSPFSRAFIQPAAGDDGQALGKLMCRMYEEHNLPRTWRMRHAFLGPRYEDADYERAFLAYGRHLVAERLSANCLVGAVGGLLADGHPVGWFRGRSEFGPRALGHRSILADPRRSDTPERIDRQFKRREWYRPFAPSSLWEVVSEWFGNCIHNPFMLVAAFARQSMKQRLPAVLHVDGSARVQAVSPSQQTFYALIQEFGCRTGVPMLVNTSFNLAGEPIVESPADALDAYLRTKLNYLVLGPWLVRRRTSAA